MNNPYGARFERDERERRALRDSRDPQHGERSYRSEDRDEDRFAAETGSRYSYNRDNEYRYDENRNRGGYGGGDFGRRDNRSNDDLYGRGSASDFGTRSYPRQQQGSFERSGYDSDREFWEGQRGQSDLFGRSSGQRSDYSMAGRNLSGGHSGGYQPEQYGQQNYGGSSRPFGAQNYGGSSGNQWEHGAGSGGSQHFGVHGGQSYGGPSGNYWEHSGGSGYQPGQRPQRFGGSSDNYWQHDDRYGGAGGHGAGYGGSAGGSSGSAGYGAMTGRSMGASTRNRPPKGYTRSDERLKEDICERLMHEGSIDAGDVSIEVKNGKVTLDGTVTERFMKHRIEDIAEDCSGVKDVENHIRVSRNGGESGSQFGQHGSTGSETRTNLQSSTEKHSASGTPSTSGTQSTSATHSAGDTHSNAGAQSSTHRSK